VKSLTVRQPPRLFFARIDRGGGPAACWPWIGPRSAGTHGLQTHGLTNFKSGGRWRGCAAHQLAYYLATGRWEHRADGRLVRHLCHNSLCCNPAHLAGGTPFENTIDQTYRDAGLFAPRDHWADPPEPPRPLPPATLKAIAEHRARRLAYQTAPRAAVHRQPGGIAR
jgi:hypothetical protein